MTPHRWTVVMLTATVAVLGADVGLVVASSQHKIEDGRLRVVVLEVQDTPAGLPNRAAPKLPEARARVDIERLPIPKKGVVPRRDALTDSNGVATTLLAAGNYYVYVFCAASNPRVPEVPRGAPWTVRVSSGRLTPLQVVCATPGPKALQRLINGAQTGG